MRIKQAYIDIDGVLANLVAQVELFLGYAPEMILGEYDLTKTFNIPLMTLMDLFADHDFWSSMIIYSHAETLVEFFHAHGIAVCFVTHAVDRPGAFSGKYKWFCEYMHDFHEDLIFIRAEHRHELAQAGRLLIDDSDKNIEQWTLNGGPCILFPQWWNSNHSLRNEPMKYIFDRFAEIENE